MKQNALFSALVAALVIALVVTSIGLLANWGLIPSSTVETGKALPLLWPMVSGVILASIGVILEVARRWFVAPPESDKLSQTYLELFAQAIITPSVNRANATTTFTEVADYFDTYLLTEDSELKESLRQKLETSVGKAIQTKFGGSDEVAETPEVLSRFAR